MPHCDVIILGDFNLPGVNWDTLTSAFSDDGVFLDFISSINLQQLINVPTHNHGNTLDIILAENNLGWERLESNMSDHNPIIVNFPIQHSQQSPSSCSFSRSSFMVESFAQCLSSLYDYIFSVPFSDADFCVTWQQYVTGALNSILRPKRKKRVETPFYYSSFTMHLLNCRNTAIRSLRMHWDIRTVEKIQQLDRDIDCSIDADKATLLCTISGGHPSRCFKFLRTLSKANNIPSKLVWNTVSATCSLSKANLLNDYFISVYKPPSVSDTVTSCSQPDICLRDVPLSISCIESMLDNVDDSTAFGCDYIPGFVLRQCEIHFYCCVLSVQLYLKSMCLALVLETIIRDTYFQERRLLTGLEL